MPGKKTKTKLTKEQKSHAEKKPDRTRRATKFTSPSQKGEEVFPIVGMGASAGGLEAFERFFTHMPSDTGIAFVVVAHLDPTHVSILPDLLKKYTRMEVFQVEDGMKVQPSSVYVIPPNKDMAILHGTLQLIEQQVPRGLRLPIDFFFRSLAEDQGERAIGIILSGAGADGTLGLKAIKGELGMAMVQDPNSAEYDGMPRSAVETRLVDYILPPERMPEQLRRYVRHAHQREAPKMSPVEGKIPDVLQKIFILLRSHTGHDFSLYKKNTIFRRIERRMNVHQIDKGSDYVRYLQQNPYEIGMLFKELLIGVTNFFRDPEAFEALKQKALRQLFEDKSADSSVRVWVPGCSSGEEAYSTAIILRECLDELKRNLNVQIFATDIDCDAIDSARVGIYPGSISVDVNPKRLKRFFEKGDSTYRIKKEIREMVVFAPQNIIKDPPFTKLDLICCRNLMIYLDMELQKKLLPLFHYSLKPGGVLFLGSSETIGGFVDLFSVLDKKWRVYKSKKSESFARVMREFPTMPLADESIEIQARGEFKKTREINIAQLAQKILLEKYAPPSAIINEKSEIIYIHGRTGKYLEPAPGEASLGILAMAREGLKPQLAAAIRKSITQEKEVTHEGLRVKDDGGFHVVNITVKPFREPEAMGGLMMVTFEDVASPKKVESDKTKRVSGKKVDKQVEEFERELRHTKEDLQTTIEELETSNEELKSTNEELQSTNEEFQSTNEELESSKEELQSLNEELVTVNSQLQGKIDEVSKANSDMRNLLDSTEIATIFLDSDLRVKGFTPHASKVINLIQTDIGRTIRHIVSNLKYDKLVEDAKEVLRTLIFRETEVQTEDGHWYLMRIMPYRTIEDVIDGMVITFVDIHAQKSSQLYAEGIVETVREPLMVLGADQRVVSASRSFYQTFKVTPEQTEGQSLFDLGDRQWDIPRLRELLGEMLARNTAFQDFEVEHEFPTIGRRVMLLNARRLEWEEGKPKLILLAIEDVTERKRAEEALKEYSERLEEMVKERTKELEEAQEQLVSREKLAILGQLAGGLGHEIRNPLGAIKNAAYFLNMALEKPKPEVKETLEILEREVAASERIISSLLGFARPKPPTRRKLDTSDVVQEALSRTPMPENVEVVSQLDKALPTILADPDQLGQVFGNIILNGTQAMPEGGQLTIRAEAPSSEWVTVSFHDTGVGIRDEDLVKLFEPLYTTKAKGIGLGLAVTKTMVERHGGTIEVESEVGKGSTFRVRLPINPTE